MNTQAETIENWISSAGETTIDTTTVDQGISDVRNNLSAAESSLSGIDYSTMDEGTRAAVQAALERVQAARSSADGIDTSSLKRTAVRYFTIKKCSRYIEKYCISSTSTAAQKTQGAVQSLNALADTVDLNRRGDHRAS